MKGILAQRYSARCDSCTLRCAVTLNIALFSAENSEYVSCAQLSSSVRRKNKFSPQPPALPTQCTCTTTLTVSSEHYHLAAHLLGTGKNVQSSQHHTVLYILSLHYDFSLKQVHSLNFTQQHILSDYKQHMIFKQPCVLLQQAIVRPTSSEPANRTRPPMCKWGPAALSNPVHGTHKTGPPQ